MEAKLKITLVSPPPGIDFGLQKGSGSKYETVERRRSDSSDLCFKFNVELKGDKLKDVLPDFRGPFVQGPINSRFIYIDIGSLAGQAEQAAWRLKIPLVGITWAMLDQLGANHAACLETTVPGTHKNGGPNCATVKPFDGWTIKE